MNTCEGYNELPTIIEDTRSRIIVIGDIHGDYNLALRTLLLGDVIKINKKNQLRWIGGDTIVVQVGDQVDRCRPTSEKTCDLPEATFEDEASDIKILELFTRVDRLARRQGGAVYSLLGNHELMNVLGVMTHVSYKNMMLFGDDYDSALKNRQDKFKPGSEYSKFLACTRQSALIIGSNLFLHAGILDQNLEELNIIKPEDLEKVNDKVRQWLLGNIPNKEVSKLVGDTEHSIFWTRVMGFLPGNLEEDDEQCHRNIDNVLKVLKIGNVVVGHTPTPYSVDSGISKTCGNKIIRVDTGSSRAFNVMNYEKYTEQRLPQVLIIENDTDYIIRKSQSLSPNDYVDEEFEDGDIIEFNIEDMTPEALKQLSI